MKKTIIAVLAVTFSVLTAKADVSSTSVNTYFYWGLSGGSDDLAKNFGYAALTYVLTKSDPGTEYYYAVFASPFSKEAITTDITKILADLSGSADSKMKVTLYDEKDNVLASSRWTAFSPTLESHTYADMATPPDAYYFSIAPEPTSGLLLLLGVAGLALKRKKI